MIQSIITVVLILFNSNIVLIGKSQKVDCPGYCVLYSKCDDAQKVHQNNKTEPIICGYEGLEPIVCCLFDEDEQQNLREFLRKSENSKERISKRKCDEFYKGYGVAYAVGGYTVLPGEYPYMAAIGYGDKKEPVYNCGGALVDKNIVITAAHCATYNGEPASVVRVGGDPEVDELTKPIPILKRVIHPNYSSDTAINDIAILFLSQQIPNKKPACISVEGRLENQTHVQATGYGAISFGGPFSRRLLKVYMNILDNEICEKAYAPASIVNSQLCVLGQKRVLSGDDVVIQDTCQGDSGGPLLRGSKIVGIVSYGQGCGSDIPGIYTNISSYIDWIESIIWPENNLEEKVYFL